MTHLLVAILYIETQASITNHQYIQRGGGEESSSIRGQISQKANKPGGESVRHRGLISQWVKKPGGKRARVAKWQRGEKAISLSAIYAESCSVLTVHRLQSCFQYLPLR